jgi:hypothetical protein
MHKIVARFAKLGSERGFSLVEVLVAGVVLVVGLIMISQFFASAAARVLNSDVRTVLHEIATEELESIRGLPYTDVGTTDGQPQGTLIAVEDRVVQNMTVHIERAVVYWTDPSYTGPYPANYRRVTVTVSDAGRDSVEPVELVTNVAGGANGGTLDITVTNVAGDPVPDAQLAITNTHLMPNVNIHSSALKTDDLGRMIVPGLTPDGTTSYVVTASKSGYNTDFTSPGVVVLDGLPYTVVQLTIDRLATMVVKVQDFEGNPVAGLNLRVVGPKSFSQYIVSTVDGVRLENIRYSSDLDPYLVRLLSNQGYPAQEIKVVLEPGSTQEIIVTLPSPVTTTTTTASTTTTTIVGVTTTTSSTTTTSTSTTSTTAPKASLKVTVYKASNSDRIKGARVTLSNGQTLTTNDQGWVFFDNLNPQSYGITVTANNYITYSNSVAVSGATTLRVYLAKDDGHGDGW